MKSVAYRALWKGIIVLVELIAAGCASAVSRETLKEVDHSIQFEELLKNPEAYRERTVLLGGDIIETQTLPEKTLIVVLQRPLGYGKKRVRLMCL